jgi:hypothetical protein
MGGEKLSLVAGETRRLPSTTKKRMKTTACFGYCQLYFGVIGLWAAVRARKHDEKGYEYEDDENLDDDGEQGDREVFYNGSTPWAPQMEDEEFWEAEEKEGEGNSEYDPEPFVQGRQDNQPAVSSRLGF